LPASRRQFASQIIEFGGNATAQHGKTAGFKRVGERTAPCKGYFPALDAGHRENRRTFFAEYGSAKLRAAR
jgi:hypothetical protein